MKRHEGADASHDAHLGPSTSGTRSVKRRRLNPEAGQIPIYQMTDKQLNRLIEAISSDEEKSDSTDWSEGESDLGESGESEDGEDEDLSSREERGEETNETHSFTTIPLLSSHLCTLRDSSIWVADQPVKSPILFAGSPGLKILPAGSNPRDFFDLIANGNFFKMIVEETNRHAENLFLNNPSPRARVTTWKDLSINEFQIFLGLLYHMGTIRLNRLNDYWKKGRLFNLTCFTDHMSRDRFLGILQALHFSKDPEENELKSDDGLYKIKPLLDIFHGNMSNIVSPTKELSLDESMVLWRGRLIFRQYIKGKRHKYRIKLYMLTEPSGLVIRIVVHSGAADEEISGRDNVVHKLLDDLKGVGHSIYMDNYYNSVKLAQDLLDDKVYCTGTLRANRKGNPTKVLSQKIKKGEVIDCWNDKGICILKWKDRRNVLMISSEFGSRMLEVRNKRGIMKTKPEAVVEYDNFMGGIDHCDQLMAYYPCKCKPLKWYKKLGIHIFQLMLINSYFLYNKYSGHKKSFYHFRLEVIDSLIPNTSGQVSRPSTSKAIDLHFPDLASVAGSRRKQKRCRVCYDKGIRKCVTTFCPDCPDEPGLCLRPCFLLYHKK